MKKWGARYTFCKRDQQSNDSRHQYDGDQGYWLLAVVAIAKVIKIPNFGQWTSQNKTTFHTVWQCFCTLYYSTCFWIKWFAQMKCYGQQVIFLHLVMNDDDWWWMMVNTPRKKGCLWGDEVMWRRAWKDRRTTPNVEYSTIPEYTEYTKYTKYTEYTTYSTIAFYIHCHIYMFHDFCSLVAQSLASALWCGVQTCAILCTAPVGNLDKRNLASARFSGIGRRISRPHIATWGSDNALLGSTQIMMRW